MSELIKYLKENDIVNNYKIFHRRITKDDLTNDDELQIELFERLPNTIIGKRAIYFMFNNINIANDDYCSHCIDDIDQSDKYEMNIFCYIQPLQHMKTAPENQIYMYSFCLHPCEQSNTGQTCCLKFALKINKKNQYDSFDLNERSSITYVIQHS